jgi:anti-anti-sigma factor
MELIAEGARTNLAVVLRIAGRIDGVTAPELELACHGWITPGDSNMILDLSEVQYMSSAGLSVVLSAGKKIDHYGGRLLICGVAGRLKQVFAFAGFDTLFPIFETREAALADCDARTHC